MNNHTTELERKHNFTVTSKLSKCIIYVNGEPALTRTDKRTGAVWLVKPRWGWLPVWFWRFKWATRSIGKRGDNMIVIVPINYDKGGNDE
jgi:hypothetical protein